MPIFAMLVERGFTDCPFEIGTMPPEETITRIFASERKAEPERAKNEGVSFSVVICTDNRVDDLKRAISALYFQTYSNFEVCVVAGPTEDGTRAFLATLNNNVKVAACAIRNLSCARNIGIAVSAGEIVAFIDDDAVPEPEWLSKLARSFDDDRVGAVGGPVHDHIGINFQAKFVTADRLGRPQDESRPTPELNFPGSKRFPHLLGTNCSFRRTALTQIGGFDETYEYFLDETDVCCRINDAGYRIVQRADAFVHHKYAPSTLRDERQVVRHWYPLIKNRLYFGLRHGQDNFDVAEIVQAALAERKFWEADVAANVATGALHPDDIERFQQEAEVAIEDGLRLWLEDPRLLSDESLDECQSGFRQFLPRSPAQSRHAILYLDPSPQDDEENAGHAVSARTVLLDQARQAAASGNLVFRIVRHATAISVDFDGDMWVHDLGTDSWPQDGIDKNLLEAVERIASRRRIDEAFCLTADRRSLNRVVNLLSREDSVLAG